MMTYNENELYALMVDAVHELYKQNMVAMMIYEKKMMKVLMRMRWRPFHMPLKKTR